MQPHRRLRAQDRVAEQAPGSTTSESPSVFRRALWRVWSSKHQAVLELVSLVGAHYR